MRKHVWVGGLLALLTLAASLTGCGPSSPSSKSIFVVRVEAWTFAEPYGIKSAASDSVARFALPPIRVMVSGKPVYLPQTSSLFSGARAIGPTGSAMVHIQIKPDAGATSYRIYRRIGSSGSYELIGERINDSAWYEDAYTDGVRWDALWFNDLDPALEITQNYYYRVKAVNVTGERDSGHEFHVMILPKFTAYLQYPANGTTISLAFDPRPGFSWTVPDTGFGTDDSMGFLIYVLNKNDEIPGVETIPFSWLHIVNGTNHATYGDYDPDDSGLGLPGAPSKPLVPNAMYEWDLLLAFSGVMYSGMDFGDSYALSYSFPRLDESSSNGAFFFNTTP